MFLLDSLMISGIRWALGTAVAAAEAEMNDDTGLREQLLEAEMRREMGEISDEEFSDLEGEILLRLREIKERREGGSGPIAFGEGEPMESSPDSRFQIEATVSGDFHAAPSDMPHTTIIETAPVEGTLIRTAGERRIAVLDLEPGDANPIAPARRRTRSAAATGRKAPARTAASPTTRTRRKARSAGPRPRTR